MSFIVQEEQRGDIEVLILSGTFLGEPDASVFQEKKFALMRNKKYKIVLDLRALKVANSAGLGYIIAAMAGARKAGGDVRLAAPTGEVDRVVSTMGLRKVFKVFATVEEAVESFSLS